MQAGGRAGPAPEFFTGPTQVHLVLTAHAKGEPVESQGTSVPAIVRRLASLPVTDRVYIGNAQVDGKDRRGWILGHFMPPGDVRHSAAVEIKWAIHQRGERREEWVAEERRSTAIILISGRFRAELPGRSVVLAEQGDYIVFHGVSHSWEAETDCVVVGVRWPSVPGYEPPSGRIP